MSNPDSAESSAAIPSYSDLVKASAELNAVSDQLAKPIEAISERIQQLGVGLEVLGEYPPSVVDR